MNLTLIQKIAIAMAVLGVLSTSGVQLSDMLGPAIAKTVVSTSSMVNSLLAAIVAVLTGQGAVVKQVLAMDGVQKIDVNEKANSTLAAIAVDPSVDKIGPTKEAASAVEATATKGT